MWQQAKSFIGLEPDTTSAGSNTFPPVSTSLQQLSHSSRKWRNPDNQEVESLSCWTIASFKLDIFAEETNSFRIGNSRIFDLIWFNLIFIFLICTIWSNNICVKYIVAQCLFSVGKIVFPKFRKDHHFVHQTVQKH